MLYTNARFQFLELSRLCPFDIPKLIEFFGLFGPLTPEREITGSKLGCSWHICYTGEYSVPHKPSSCEARQVSTMVAANEMFRKMKDSQIRLLWELKAAVRCTRLLLLLLGVYQ